MIVSDFIVQTRMELQEKKEFWGDAELLLKLRRAYVSLQFDLPYFMTSEEVVIKEGKDRCYLDKKPLKDITLTISDKAFCFIDDENLYRYLDKDVYSFSEQELIFSKPFLKESTGFIRYKYEKEIKTDKCEIEIPLNWHKALRLLFMAEIQEKPTRNTKDRNLSEYYLQKYKEEILKLKQHKTVRAKGITSDY
ncbi:MAG: hypothetical protein ACMV1K_01445, partial [Sulfurospirillum sp.]